MIDAAVAAVLDAIDAANAHDPNLLVVRGEEGPKELLCGRLAQAWVEEFEPQASGEQLVAARGHHLRRWAHPRHAYPEGRAGYLRWRTAAKRAHAEELAAMVGAGGLPVAFADRVGQIVRKEGLGVDPAVQVHEDALCLVFVETQLDATASQLGEPKAIEVIRKTLAKMSPGAVGRAAALVAGTQLERLVAAAATDPTERHDGVG